jgi:hypothetical protein
VKIPPQNPNTQKIPKDIMLISTGKQSLVHSLYNDIEKAISFTLKVALAVFIIQSVLKERNIDEKTVEESMAETKKADTRFGELEIV